VEEKTSPMNLLRAIAYTILVVVVAITLIATLYISIWLILAIGVILLFTSIYNVLKAKSHLLENTNEL
jgi:4-hydroxybenzoate polyprenyltransferase